MANRSVCKGCGAVIIFATNPATGKQIPLDPRTRVYRLVELNDGKCEAIREDDEELMISHFATCPKAKDFSGKNRC